MEKVPTHLLGKYQRYFSPVYSWQIKKMLEIVRATAHHTHIFCTKNSLRYSAYNPWPANCILLTTVTNQKDADERIPELLRAEARVLGVSHEPLLGEITIERLRKWPQYLRPAINWAIIGALTGPGAVKPKPEEVQDLIDQYRAAGVPIFIKNNLRMQAHSIRCSALPRPEQGLPKGYDKCNCGYEKIQDWPE